MNDLSEILEGNTFSLEYKSRMEYEEDRKVQEMTQAFHEVAPIMDKITHQP